MGRMGRVDKQEVGGRVTLIIRRRGPEPRERHILGDPVAVAEIMLKDLMPHRMEELEAILGIMVRVIHPEEQEIREDSQEERAGPVGF